jgi:transposase InsO family protein
MKENADCFAIVTMCECLEVSRSGYYEWFHRGESATKKENSMLTERVKNAFHEGRGTYGTRRIQRQLAKQNHMVSRRRIGRLMAESGLACKTKRRFKPTTTDSKHALSIAPNLLNRQFSVAAPNRVWAGDITYIPTQEGWLYLATVIDLYSRQVVGWSMQNHMRAELVNDAILAAIWKRKPAANLIWHTDRGSQYASTSHREILADHTIVQSMSRKGNCWDNAVSESFFHTLKTELTHQKTFETIERAKQAVFEYIEVFYNRTRIHSNNNYMSPVDYENMHANYAKSA